jgi:uncharacterized protein (DUF697 family)
MAIWDPLHPNELKKLANRRLSDLVLRELTKSRRRVADLEKTYPSAGLKEKAQRLIDGKKAIAGLVGGVSGVFGLVSVPADLLALTWLQLVLLVDVATLYKVNLRTDSARDELLDLFGEINGIGPFQRAGPKVLGKVAQVLLEKGGWSVVGRAVPVVAAPISAFLNNAHIQQVGDEAMRHFEGLAKAEKRRPRETAEA